LFDGVILPRPFHIREFCPAVNELGGPSDYPDRRYAVVAALWRAPPFQETMNQSHAPIVEIALREAGET
jgi:hypothetical protein